MESERVFERFQRIERIERASVGIAWEWAREWE
jgi:hypothetical protein